VSQSLFARIESVLKSKTQIQPIPSSLEELTVRAHSWYGKNVKFRWPSWGEMYGTQTFGEIFFGSILCGMIACLAGMLGSFAWGGAWGWKIVSVLPFVVVGVATFYILSNILAYPLHIATRIRQFIRKRKGRNLQVSELLSNYMDAEIERCKNQTLGEASPIIMIKKEIEHVGQELRTLKEQFKAAQHNAQEDLQEALQGGFERVDNLLKRLDESEDHVRSHQAKFEAFFEECKSRTHKIGGPLKTRQLFEKLAHYESDAKSLLGRVDEALYASTFEVEQALRHLANQQVILLPESGAAAGLSGRTHDESVQRLEGTIQRLMDETEVPSFTSQSATTKITT